ncbi:MAG: hypothetical protein ABIH63_04590 [archaeon]
MKKMMIIGIALLIGISIAIAINTQEKNRWECRNECEKTFKAGYEDCKETYDTGKDACKTTQKTCINDTKNYMKECRNLRENRIEYRECMKTGSEQLKACAKQNKECNKEVRDIFLGCLREGRTTWDACKLNCKETFMAEKECEKLGGTWNPCASACEEGAENCIDVCVPKCEYKTCETAQDCNEQGKKYNCVNNQCIKGK